MWAIEKLFLPELTLATSKSMLYRSCTKNVSEYFPNVEKMVDLHDWFEIFIHL